VRLATIEKQLSEQNLSLGQTVEEKTNQLVRTEAKLVTAAKMCALGEMAGGIAHEINTPLGTIALLAEQLVELSREVPMNAELVSKMAASIGPTVERINQIILGLRTFSREGSKDDFESTSLAGIVASTLALCQEKVKSSRVDLRIEPIADHIVIRCRAVQISQVLLNLISNSCHAIAAAPEKWIQISVRASRDFTEIMVADSGSGIAPEVQEKMFQPFYTTKEIGEGTGLGLSISKGIAEIHGGSLILDQTSPHTCLVLRLPSAA
jgi:C4-dicarboxylate-specific signal transduction histidine kinase